MGITSYSWIVGVSYRNPDFTPICPVYNRAMTLKNDRWILQQCQENHLIYPYIGHLEKIRRIYVGPDVEMDIRPVISYGLSSFGYDLRLGEELKLFGWDTQSIDPKERPMPTVQPLLHDHSLNGPFYVLKPGDYALGVSVERIIMPPNVHGLCVGKSTYARCGLHVNMTPVEAGWEGHLTLELSNPTNHPIRVYPDEGICQIMFFEGEEPKVTYADRAGKYQNQPAEIVPATV